MRVNGMTIDLMAEDLHALLDNYARWAIHNLKGVPDKIVIPMIESIPIPKDGVYGTRPKGSIPVVFLPVFDPYIKELTEDVGEQEPVSDESWAAADKREDELKQTKDALEAAYAEIQGLKQPADSPVTAPSAAKKALANTKRPKKNKSPQKSTTRAEKATVAPVTDPPVPAREPKRPDNPVTTPGLGISDTRGRDKRDQRDIRRALLDEPDVNEVQEIPVVDTDEIARAKQAMENK